MELSKKAAYLQGLIAGLKIDESEPTGQVIRFMADMLEEMADRIEDEESKLEAVIDYIDELEEGADPLDEIDTYEHDFDPLEYDSDDSSQRYAQLLDNITSDPDYTDSNEDIKDKSHLVGKLENIVQAEQESQDDDEEVKELTRRLEKAIGKRPDYEEDNEPKTVFAADNADELAFIDKLEQVLEQQTAEEQEIDSSEDNIFFMNCPVCKSEIEFTADDIYEGGGEFDCPACGNRIVFE